MRAPSAIQWASQPASWSDMDGDAFAVRTQHGIASAFCEL